MSLAAGISHALHGVKGCNGNFLCRCPAPQHGNGNGDRTRSLSIKDGDRGLMVHCFAGCAAREVYRALRNRGLLPKNNPYREHPVDDPWQPGRAEIRRREDLRAHCGWLHTLGPDGLFAFIIDLKRGKRLDDLLAAYSQLACGVQSERFER